jgi:bacteriorhodopsin
LLTVPLLLIELILVMRLSQEETVSKALKLGSAAALMILLGYPGEVATDISTRVLWGTLSSIPFLYIVYQLFVGLGASIANQPENVRGLVKKARLLTFASWGFYPIVYMIPYTNLSGSNVTVGVEIGYTIADLIAKAGVGVLIYMIAVRKSQVEYGDKAVG